MNVSWLKKKSLYLLCSRTQFFSHCLHYKILPFTSVGTTCFSHTTLSLSLSLSLSLILYGIPLSSFSSKRLHATLLVNVSWLKKISLSSLLSHTQFSFSLPSLQNPSFYFSWHHIFLTHNSLSLTFYMAQHFILFLLKDFTQHF